MAIFNSKLLVYQRVFSLFTKSELYLKYLKMFGFKKGGYTTWFIGHGGRLGFYMMDPIHRTEGEHHRRFFKKQKWLVKSQGFSDTLWLCQQFAIENGDL